MLARNYAAQRPHQANPDPMTVSPLLSHSPALLPVVSAQNLKKREKIIVVPSHPK